MITLLIGLAAVVGAFVAGVLVGRRNPKKVEKIVDLANETVDKAKKIGD